MIYIIQINNQFWQLNNDGFIVKLTNEQYEALLESGAEVFVVQDNINASSDFQDSITTESSIIDFFASLTRLGSALLPQSGFNTTQLNSSAKFFDQRQLDERVLAPPLSDDAEIRISIEDNGDGFINMFEVANVLLSGSTLNILDRQLITVTLLDSKGLSVEFITSLASGRFSIPSVDLSDLAQGELLVTATAADLFGNSVSATDTSIIDTLAFIEDDVVFDAGLVINASEIDAVSFVGSTSEINQGQLLNISITDGTGRQVTSSALLAADGRFSVNDLNLALLADGILTVALQSTDIAGNIAEQAITVVKDTLAQITVNFLGQPPYGAAELASVVIGGSVVGIEPGQPVAVIISDGNTILNLTTTVLSDNSYRTTPQDLTGFDNGELIASVMANDLAGNNAVDKTATFIDTAIALDIVTDLAAINIDALRSNEKVVIQGVTSDVEVGQPVTLRFFDSRGGEQTFTAVVLADNSWETTVLVDGLDSFASWNLIVSVADLAGNIAEDNPPSLDQPTLAVLSEGALASFPVGYSQESTIRIQDYDELVFTNSQPSLASLQSSGINLTVTVAADGQSLTGSAGTTEVLKAAFTAAGVATITLLAVIDKPSFGSNNQIGITLQATQNDSDLTSETVTVNIPVLIRQETEFAVNDNYSTTEQTLSSGNLLANDLTLEGPLSIVLVNAPDINGVATNIVVPQVGIKTILTDKGLLTIAADGNWSFLAARNLDNNAIQELSFTYGAVDQDEDFDSASVTIDIGDGAGGVFPGGSLLVTETGYRPVVIQPQIDFVVTAGSDDLVASSIIFSNQQVQLINALDYKSQGQSITAALIDNGKTLEATAAGNIVFKLTLVATLDGATGNLNAIATLDQSLPLDHQIISNSVTQSVESLVLPLVVEAADTDGTQAISRSELSIIDGLLPTLTALSADVNEADLATNIASVDGSIEWLIGSDRLVRIALDDRGPQLSSGGDELFYNVDSSGLLLTAMVGGDSIFTLQLAGQLDSVVDESLGFTFTLLQALDHFDDAGNNITDLPLSFGYTVSDYDGDQVSSTIDLTVTDSAPGAVASVALTVSEAPRSLDSIVNNISVEDIVYFDLAANQDEITNIRFTQLSGQTVVDSNGDPVLQNTSGLTWQQSSDSSLKIINATGEVVVDFSLPASLSINSDDTSATDAVLGVAVLQALDQISNNDSLSINIPVAVADFDLSETDAEASITIVDGRDPIAIAIQNLAVLEADIVTNNANDTGRSFIVGGSDELTTTEIILLTSLSSSNTVVVFATEPDSDGWWIGSISEAEEIFRLRISADGESEFILGGPIDHHNPGNDIQTIEFQVTTIDADGDISNVALNNLSISVTDDIPTLSNRDIFISEGNTKAFDVLAAGEAGADGGLISAITYNGMIVTDFQNPIELFRDTDKYGELTVDQAGAISISTTPTANNIFTDSFSYTVTDGDNDTDSKIVTLLIGDEQPSIRILPKLVLEDAVTPLDLTAIPGDLDNRAERITTIRFDQEALQGGVLTLDEAPLNLNANGKPILTEEQLRIVDQDTRQVAPNGNLAFRPFENSSDAIGDPVVFKIKLSITGGSLPRFYEQDFPITVVPVADAPIFIGTPASYTYQLEEDGEAKLTNIQAELQDTDGSEELTYRFESGSNTGPTKSISDGLLVTVDGIALEDGQLLTEDEISRLTISAEENVAGAFSFTIDAIATETANNVSAPTTQPIVVNIAPVADTPILATLNFDMLEDTEKPLKEFLEAELTDSSERLEYTLEIPAGWSIIDSAGVAVTASGGKYRVTDDAVQNDGLALLPLEDISSVGNNFSITVQAVSVALPIDGVPPLAGQEEAFSSPRQININVEGVVDLPAITPDSDGLWSFDGSTIRAITAEDQLIPLNFGTGTEDDDSSEVFDFVLQDISEDIAIVDSAGDRALLAVRGEFNGLPQYVVSATQLAQLFLKPPTDFSGSIDFTLLQTNTEPDGDTGTTSLAVNINVLPVIDTNNGVTSVTRASEDIATILRFEPTLADIDQSETLSNVIILIPPTGVEILLDYIVLELPLSGLNLQQVAADLGVSFTDLIGSGRLRITGPEDSDADFNVPVIFEISDQSANGSIVKKGVTGNLAVKLVALVDDNDTDGITRLESVDSILTSTDGSPIGLTDAVFFIEEDIDGSEFLDYIQITVPESTDWFVSYPDVAGIKAINDGDGNWLISANGLTSENIVESMQSLLDGAIINTSQQGVFDIVVSARVVDRNDRADGEFGNDADIIQTIIKLDFQVASNAGIAENVDAILNPGAIIDGVEQQIITLSEHISAPTLVEAGVNDVVSYRVDAADMTYGGLIRGSGLITEYQDDGSTIKAFVFTDQAFSDLRIRFLDEDFAGLFNLKVNKISTDPLGDTISSVEFLPIEIEPVVDDLRDPTVDPSIEPQAVLPINMGSLIEDTPQNITFDFATLLADSSNVSDQGLESIIGLKFVNFNNQLGSFDAPVGLLTVISVGTDNDTVVVTDFSRLNEVIFTPEKNADGILILDLVLTIQDQTSVTFNLPFLQKTVSSEASVAAIFDIIAVTDPAPIFTANKVGMEDELIALKGIFVLDEDRDGSETLTIQLAGVPEGAVLFWAIDGNADNLVATNLEQLNNAGPASSPQSGQVWTFNVEQSKSLVLRPPLDFAGDMELTLTSTSMELSTLEIVEVSKTFMVSILPVADDAYFYSESETAEAIEGAAIMVSVFASTQEVVAPNETITLSVTILGNQSASTALQGLLGIRTPEGKTALFVSSGDNFVASLNTATNQLNDFELIVGDDAFGELALDITIGTIDSATVDGVLAEDSTDIGDLVTRSFTLNIIPQPDPPLIIKAADIITSAEDRVPLGLSIDLASPATAIDEVSFIAITGLPDGITLNFGSYDGTTWLIDAVDVANLAIENASANSNYQLTIEGRAELDGNAVQGPQQLLLVKTVDTSQSDNMLTADNGAQNLLIGGDGNDELTGGTADDTFLFRSEDLATAVANATDTIIDFDRDTDHIDLSDIAAANISASDLANIIVLTETSGGTKIEIDASSNDKGSILLLGVSIEDLYGDFNGVSPGDVDIIDKLLTDNVLLTG